VAVVRAVALALTVLLSTSGCVEILGLVVSVASTGVGAYQRRSARIAQDAQTTEIKALREEIARHRARALTMPSDAVILP